MATYLLARILLFAGLLIAILLALGLHEAGHLIGGRLVRFRFMLFVAGPLKVLRKGADIEIGLNRNLSLFGGFAASVPVDNHDIRRRMAVMTAAGPVTSIVIGLIVFGMLQLAAPLLPDRNIWRILLTSMGAGSVMVGLVSSIPMRSGGFNSDGARVLSLLRKDPKADRWTAISAITAASLGGVRPRDWQPDWLQTALTLPDGSLDDISARIYAYYYHLDREEVATAREHLEYALDHAENYPSALRPGIFVEAAYFSAWFDRDAAAGRDHLQKIDRGLALEKHTHLRAEAAVLFAEGQRTEAAAVARQGLDAAKHALAQGSAKAEADWLQGILAACSEPIRCK